MGASADREKIIEKIRALKAKTTANGCTEAEAMAAAEKIAQLMSDYELTETDVELGATQCKKGWVETAVDDPITRCATAVGYFTDTKVWVEENEDESVYEDGIHVGWRTVPFRVVFFGLPKDVEIAEYIFAICQGALTRASEEYRQEVALFRAHVRERKVREFQWGMADSMARRLRQLRNQRKRQVESTGRDLVPLKNSLIERDFGTLDINLRGGGPCRMGIDDDAYHDGRRTGEEVAFNEGVRGSGTTGLLGKG